MVKKYSPAVRTELESKAWSLRQRCWTLDRIGAELGVDKGTVSRWLQRVELRVLDEQSKTVALVKARQTMQLEQIAAEAMAEWERSKRDAERYHMVERAVRKDGASVTTSVTDETLEGRVGDAELLGQVRGALADIRKIWGADAAQKIETRLEPVKLYAVGNSPDDL